jgi:hypothetical protein
MRVLVASLLGLLSIVDLAKLQAAEPRFRPALIGNGPKALVNVINTKRLVDKGQRDGLLMFTCYVSGSGTVGNYAIYRETPGSKLLKEELGYAFRDCRFIPAIYNGERTDVLFAGTVVFSVNDGKPHLRIYANQNHDDIQRGNDFIAPQVIASTPDWQIDRSELEKARVYHQSGAVELSVTVDTNGNLKDLKVISEEPPGFGFGDASRKAYAKAKYIPGFRNGYPVDCTFDYADYVWARDRFGVIHRRLH